MASDVPLSNKQTNLKFNVSYDDDTEASGSHDQLKTRWKRCPFCQRKNWSNDDASLTGDSNYFK